MFRRRRRGLLPNFAAYLTWIPSPAASPSHWRWSPAPLDFRHFFHQIGPGPLPHWIFSLATNKVRLPQFSHPPPPPPSPLNGSLIRPAFHTCPLLYLFINFIPSPFFLLFTHNCVAAVPIFFVVTR